MASGETSTSLNVHNEWMSQLEAAGVTEADAQHVASHLGRAMGIATLLRGTAHHAQR